MARNRSRSNSTVSLASSARAPTASPQLKRQFAAASDSIYHNNMTVLRRRDPTITTILDSFSHVCLYHYTGSKWEKQGFEGSMFLVEHEDTPHYGIFILNRMGTGDWGRRIYAEDDMQVVGDYLMYRHYPDYTNRRMQLGLPYPIPPDFQSIFDSEFARDANGTDPGPPSKEKKGNSDTLGLWMFPTDAREPLKDVLLRLLSYVKKGERYPDEFRYGPGRPAPSNPHLRRPSISDAEEMTPRISSLPQGTGSSEVDKLFAKLQPRPQSQTSNTNNPPPPTTAEHWFAALTGQTNGQEISHTPSPGPSGTRGLALLDTIFASASQQPAPPTRYHLPPHPEEITIVSPKPQSSALPQILNQDVISTLLGLASDNSSRASSVAPSTTSSRRSGLNRYEGDNELSDHDSISEASYSATSTVADSDPAILAVGPSHVPTVSFNPGSSDSDTDENGAGSSRRVQGDVTPRVPARGIDPHSPPPILKSNSQQFLAPANGISRKDKNTARPDLSKPSSSTSSTSTSTVKAANQRGQRLVPFEADSELWPYPRAPLDERPTEHDNDVVELDFSDTRALSDPAVFSNRLQKQKKKKEGRKKKTKEERAAEKQKERDAIELSWDDPTNGQAGAVDMLTQPGAPTFAPPPPAPIVNGNGNGKVHSPTSPVASTSNGIKSDLVNGQTVQESLLSTLLGHPKAPKPDISRKHFLQEVLTLIYSDNTFVDKLYDDYVSRV